MGWFKAGTDGALRRGAGGITIALSKPPTATLAALRVRLGCNAQQLTGWSDSQRVTLWFGDREHAGQIALRPVTGNDGVRLRGVGPSISAAFGRLPGRSIPGADAGTAWTLIQQPHASTEVEGVMHGNELIITLPREWFTVSGPAQAALTPQRQVTSTPVSASTRPNPDPDDPRLQEHARQLLAKGCSLPDLRVRLRLNEKDFRQLCDVLRAKATTWPPTGQVESSTDTRTELARIRKLVDAAEAVA